MREKRLRSIFKGVTWRIVATLTTFTLAAFVFREDPKVFEKAGIVAALEIIAKVIIYYLHERAWLKVKWGMDDLPS